MRLLTNSGAGRAQEVLPHRAEVLPPFVLLRQEQRRNGLSRLPPLRLKVLVFANT